MCEWCKMRIFPAIIREEIGQVLVLDATLHGVPRDEIRRIYIEFIVMGSVHDLPPLVANLFSDYADHSYN